jgi:hypothetical protein
VRASAGTPHPDFRSWLTDNTPSHLPDDVLSPAIPIPCLFETPTYKQPPPPLDAYYITTPIAASHQSRGTLAHAQGKEGIVCLQLPAQSKALASWYSVCNRLLFRS